MNKHHWYFPSAFGVAIALSPLTSSVASAQDLVSDALKTSDIKLNLRLRVEDVDQDGLDSASAFTQRTRLTYTSGDLQGFTLLLEMDDVTAWGDVDYNDGTGINTGTAAIVDPEGTEVNQAYLAYKAGESQLKYGRQRILLDNQRFVGGVGWRQNEQTYDSFSVTNSSVEELTVFYAYVHNVNRIFGEAVAAGDHKHQTHLFNTQYAGWSAGTLIGYAYLIDNESAPALASDTVGLRWQGKVNDTFSYNLEYASQTEAGDNPTDYTADYLMAEAMAALATFNFKLGYEVLGSDGGNAAFTTSLATLHAFQGWTDKFLATPTNGVEDLYFSAGTKLGGINLSLVYRDLKADEGDMDYGTEASFLAGTKLGPVAFTLKYADYSADDFATDTRKVWLMGEATF
ncbi:MAG: alginate export family protein [Cellvibrionaceae bacterium]